MSRRTGESPPGTSSINSLTAGILLALWTLAAQSARCGDKETLEWVQEAFKATQNASFAGRMVYTRYLKEGPRAAEFTVHYVSETQMRVQFHSPSIVENNILLVYGGGIWVTPLDEESKDRLRDEMDYFPWHRFMRPRGRAFFQEELELDKPHLLLSNYDLDRSRAETPAGGAAVEVWVKPRHDKRPSLRMVFDQESKIQLTCTRYGHKERPLEAYTFKTFDARPRFSDDLFETDGLIRLFSIDPEEDGEEEHVQPDFEPFPAGEPPEGFVKTGERTWKGRSGVVRQMSFTDGFARLSLFQRLMSGKDKEQAKEEENGEGKKTVVNRTIQRGETVFFLFHKGIRISAVGDLPSHEIIKFLIRTAGC